MTKLKLLLAAPVLLGAIMTSPMSIAQGDYLMTGEIYSLTATQINLDDAQFKLSPMVKVRLEQGKIGRLSDLKTGDYVGIKMLNLGKRRLVDWIHKVKRPADD